MKRSDRGQRRHRRSSVGVSGHKALPCCSSNGSVCMQCTPPPPLPSPSPPLPSPSAPPLCTFTDCSERYRSGSIEGSSSYGLYRAWWWWPSSWLTKKRAKGRSTTIPWGGMEGEGGDKDEEGRERRGRREGVARKQGVGKGRLTIVMEG